MTMCRSPGKAGPGNQMGPAEALGSSQRWALRTYLNGEMEHEGSLSGSKIYVRRKLACI